MTITWSFSTAVCKQKFDDDEKCTLVTGRLDGHVNQSGVMWGALLDGAHTGHH